MNCSSNERNELQRGKVASIQIAFYAVRTCTIIGNGGKNSYHWIVYVFDNEYFYVYTNDFIETYIIATL